MVGKGNLDLEFAFSAAEPQSRAYPADQVRAVVAGQSPRNALATEIACRAALRAYELLMLRRSGEATAAVHRRWSAHRFAERAGQRYVVTGKAGLRREVLVPRDLAARLEARRLDAHRFTGLVSDDQGMQAARPREQRVPR